MVENWSFVGRLFDFQIDWNQLNLFDCLHVPEMSQVEKWSWRNDQKQTREIQDEMCEHSNQIDHIPKLNFDSIERSEQNHYENRQEKEINWNKLKNSILIYFYC